MLTLVAEQFVFYGPWVTPDRRPKQCRYCNGWAAPSHSMSQYGRCETCQARHIKDLWLRQKYRITIDDWDAMREAQGGGCYLCGLEKELHVDHDHGTGVVRALLCVSCNTGLGRFGDDPGRLRAAAEYVERHRLGAVA